METPDFSVHICYVSKEIHSELPVSDLAVAYLNHVLHSYCIYFLESLLKESQHKKTGRLTLNDVISRSLGPKLAPLCISTKNEMLNEFVENKIEADRLTIFPFPECLQLWKKYVDDVIVFQIMIVLEVITAEILQTAGDMNLLNAEEVICKFQIDDAIISLFPTWSAILNLSSFKHDDKSIKESSWSSCGHSKRLPDAPSSLLTTGRRLSITSDLSKMSKSASSSDLDSKRILEMLSNVPFKRVSAGIDSGIPEDVEENESIIDKLSGCPSPSLKLKKSVSSDCIHNLASQRAQSDIVVLLPGLMKTKIKAEPRMLMKDIIEAIVDIRYLEIGKFKLLDSQTNVEVDFNMPYTTESLLLDISGMKEDCSVCWMNDKLEIECFDSDGMTELTAIINKEIFEIKTGTPVALIQRLASEYPVDLFYMDIIALTYRGFTTAAEMFKILYQQYMVTPTEEPTEEEQEYYDKWKSRIQMKVIKFLHKWMGDYFMDFVENKTLLNDIFSFCNIIINDGYTGYGQDLHTLLEERLAEYEVQINKAAQLTSPIVSKTRSTGIENQTEERKMFIFHANALEIAQQLTYIDWNIFKDIHQSEFINNLWKSKEPNSRPMLVKITTKINELGFWVATEICTEIEYNRRTKLLSIFIQVAAHLLEMNNFLTLWGVLSGLTMVNIAELKRTWNGIKPKYQEMYDELSLLMDPTKNMKNYRLKLKESKSPCMPFLPVAIKDLFIVNETLKSKVDGRTNLEKMRVISTLILTGVKQYQAIPYDIEKNEEYYSYFMEAPVINNTMFIKKSAKFLQDHDKKLKQQANVSDSVRRKFSRRNN